MKRVKNEKINSDYYWEAMTRTVFPGLRKLKHDEEE